MTTSAQLAARAIAPMTYSLMEKPPKAAAKIVARIPMVYLVL